MIPFRSCESYGFFTGRNTSGSLPYWHQWLVVNTRSKLAVRNFRSYLGFLTPGTYLWIRSLSKNTVSPLGALQRPRALAFPCNSKYVKQVDGSYKNCL